MDEINTQQVQDQEKNLELFDELTVTELEDRLELVDRCLCRIRPA